MTTEIELNSERYSEIASLLYTKAPSVMEIDKAVLRHVEKVHRFEEFPSFEKLYSEIEHIDAVIAGRRNLDELA